MKKCSFDLRHHHIARKCDLSIISEEGWVLESTTLSNLLIIIFGDLFSRY